MFVSDPAQVTAFDAVFARVRRPGAGEPEAEEPGPRRAADDAAELRHRRRRHRAPGDAPAARATRSRGAEVEVPLAVASDEERLGRKSFDALEPYELAQLYRLMSRLRLATPERQTRRRERARHGQQIDMRRTLRASLRTGGDPVRLARRRRRVVPRRLVMLCDISGSMEPYARAYLQFLTCAAGGGPNAEAFAFATRLTRLTRALRSRRPERAIQRAAAAAPDWSSGTRIGDALKEFNDRHGRRGMARGAVVVILSDGWERGDPALVGREMERLARLAHRIVWVNPRVGASAFSVQAGGMVAALRALRRPGERPQLRGARRGGGRDRRAARPVGSAAAPSAGEPGSRGPAPRRCRAARWRCRAATARAGATRRQGGDAMTPERPASTRAASGPRCRRTRSAGPQPAFCDLEEHNALTAHQERERLASATDARR